LPNLLERPTGVDALVDFAAGRRGARPVAVGIERHEFDKAHDDAALAGEQGESFDFVVVEPRTRTAFTLAGASRDFWATSMLWHHG